MRELPRCGKLRIVCDDAENEYFVTDASVTPDYNSDEGVQADIFFQGPPFDKVFGVTPESLLAIVLDRLTQVSPEKTAAIEYVRHALDVLAS